jgi:hypothetical protein
VCVFSRCTAAERIVVAMDIEAIDLSAVYISASLFDGSEFVTKRTTVYCDVLYKQMYNCLGRVCI